MYVKTVCYFRIDAEATKLKEEVSGTEVMQIASTKDNIKTSEKVDLATQEVVFSLKFLTCFIILF